MAALTADATEPLLVTFQVVSMMSCTTVPSGSSGLLTSGLLTSGLSELLLTSGLLTSGLSALFETSGAAGLRLLTSGFDTSGVCVSVNPFGSPPSVGVVGSRFSVTLPLKPFGTGTFVDVQVVGSVQVNPTSVTLTVTDSFG